MVTQTVTSTPSVLAGSDPQTNGQSGDLSLQNKGLSGGAIAGAVVGSLIGLALLLLGAFLLWRRKKKPEAEAAAEQKPRSPRRNTSVLSKVGLLSSARVGRESADEKYFDDPSRLDTGGNSSARHSMLFGAGAIGQNNDGVSPVSPLGGSYDDGRRHSRPLVYDQRLNPNAIFANAEARGSRVSIGTMQDNNDYSRPLGVANPDPRVSTDSRGPGS